MKLRILKTLVIILSITLAPNAWADLKVTKTTDPGKVLLHASGLDAHYYSLRIKGIISTLVNDFTVQVNAECQADIIDAQLDCENLGWAPLDVILAEDSESLAYFDASEMQLDAQNNAQMSMELLSVFIYAGSEIIEVEAATISDGEQCFGGGTATVSTGQTKCERSTTSDGHVYETCCPEQCTFNCEYQGPNQTPSYIWKSMGCEMDRNSDQCHTTYIGKDAVIVTTPEA